MNGHQDFEPNVKRTFAGKELIIVKHEKGVVCFIANPETLNRVKSAEIADIAAEETSREGEWKELPTLDVTEEAGLLTRPNLALQVETLLEDGWPPPKKKDK